MAKSEVERFSDRVDEMKKQNGLKDIKFFPGIISETIPEQFGAEANRLLDAAVNGEGTKLVFNDLTK